MTDYPSILKELDAFRKRIEATNENTPFDVMKSLLGNQLFPYICDNHELNEYFIKQILYRLNLLENKEYLTQHSKLLELILEINTIFIELAKQYQVDLKAKMFDAIQPFDNQGMVAAPEFIKLTNDKNNYVLPKKPLVAEYQLANPIDIINAYQTLREIKNALYPSIHQPLDLILKFFKTLETTLSIHLLGGWDDNDAKIKSATIPKFVQLKKLITLFEHSFTIFNVFAYVTPQDLGVDSFEYLLSVRYFLSHPNAYFTPDDEYYINGQDDYENSKHHGLRIIDELQKQIKQLAAREKARINMPPIDERSHVLKDLVYSRWEDITIEFIDDESVKIMAYGQNVQTDYRKMKFQDTRKKYYKSPNKQWNLLIYLAIHNGQITKKDKGIKPEDAEKLRKKIYSLSEQLKQLTGLVDSDPFSICKNGVYSTRFNILPGPLTIDDYEESSVKNNHKPSNTKIVKSKNNTNGKILEPTIDDEIAENLTKMSQGGYSKSDLQFLTSQKL